MPRSRASWPIGPDAEAERVKGLDKEGILSQEQIDERRYAAQSARAQAVAQADAAEDMRTREGLMTVRSPEAGLVFERNVKVGDMGAGTTPWFRIARDGKVELAADVSEEDIEKIRPGMSVRVSLADQAEVMGVVRLVSPGVDTNTRLGRVRVSLPVRPDIRAGGFARANCLGISHSANAVPERAVRYDADGASVLLVGANDKVMRVPVTTGQRGGGYVELLCRSPLWARTWSSAPAPCWCPATLSDRWRHEFRQPPPRRLPDLGSGPSAAIRCRLRCCSSAR